MNDPLEAKLNACRQILRWHERVVVAFSAGVDSTFLLAVAVETLGAQNVLAATCISEVVTRRERREAVELARRIGVDLEIVDVSVLRNDQFVSNSPRRCYYCKREIFEGFVRLARRRGYHAVCSGDNADDTGDYRPGLQAEKELGIAQPLMEAGLTKANIRELSHHRGLPTWSRSSMACLASRVPYGQAIEADKLERIEQAEEFLRSLGFAQYRVRHHGDRAPLARIEVPPAEIPRAIEQRESIAERLKELGFAYVSLDLHGFRSGSMNEPLGLGSSSPAGDPASS